MSSNKYYVSEDSLNETLQDFAPKSEWLCFEVPVDSWEQYSDNINSWWRAFVEVPYFTENTVCGFIGLDTDAMDASNAAELREAWSLIDKANTNYGGIALEVFNDTPPQITIPIVVKVEEKNYADPNSEPEV